MMERSSLAVVLSCLAVLACSSRGPNSAPQTGPAFVPIASAEGQIGRLRKLDAFPLYELVYEAAYARPAAARLRPRAEGGFACTCFAATDASGSRVMGRNFDWDRHPALVLHAAPADGYASISLVDIHYLGYGAGLDPLADPAALRDAVSIPFDGLNDRGLAVGMMAVSRASGVSPLTGASGEPRPRVGELGLIRLLLDGAADVDEAIAIMENTDVDFDEVPLHYFVADKGGASAVVEYLGGRATVLRNGEAWQVSTNFLFAETPEASRAGSCTRYATASATLAASGGILTGRGALGLLAKVAQTTTIWSSSYGLAEGSLELALGGDFSRAFSFEIAAE